MNTGNVGTSTGLGWGFGGIIGNFGYGVVRDNIVFSNAIISGRIYVGGIVGMASADVGYTALIKNNLAGGEAINNGSLKAQNAHRVLGGNNWETFVPAVLRNNCANADMLMRVDNTFTDGMVLDNVPIPVPDLNHWIDPDGLNGDNCEFTIFSSPEDIEDLACLDVNCACPNSPVAPAGRSFSFDASVPDGYPSVYDSFNAMTKQTRALPGGIAEGLGVVVLDIGIYIKNLANGVEIQGNLVNFGITQYTGPGPFDDLIALNDSVSANLSANAGVVGALSEAVCCIVESLCRCVEPSPPTGPTGPVVGNLCVSVQVVTDVSNACISGLEYILTDEDTGATETVTTDEYGVLKLEGLIAGDNYTLTPSGLPVWWIDTWVADTDTPHTLIIDAYNNVTLDGKDDLKIKLNVKIENIADMITDATGRIQSAALDEANWLISRDYSEVYSKMDDIWAKKGLLD